MDRSPATGTTPLSEHGQDVDAIMIFAGTNDYNASVPVGEWFFEDECGVEVSGGNIDVRRRRTPVVDESTFCGRINSVMSYLKSNFPRAQIILLTPLHRAYAVFGTDNVQPDESYSNAMGYFLDEYVETVRKASDIWSVPVIDLYSDSGLYPLCKEHAIYFHSEKTDMLHPAAAGHCRIAKTLMYAMQALPSGFRDDD